MVVAPLKASHNVRCGSASGAKGAEKRGFVPQIEGGESLLTLPYPEPGEPPQVRLWHAEELGADWRPPLCTGWGEKRFDQLVALAGGLPASVAAEDLARLSAVSEWCCGSSARSQPHPMRGYSGVWASTLPNFEWL